MFQNLNKIKTIVVVMIVLAFCLPLNGQAQGPASALSFNGSSYVSLGTVSTAPLGDNARTVEAWVKTTSTAYGIFFAYGGTGLLQRFTVGVEGGLINVEANNSIVKWTATGVNNGAWHHISVSYPGTHLGMATVYLDGSPLSISSTNSNPVALTTTSGPGYIGSLDGASFYFNGQVDDLRVWNVARGAPTDRNTELIGNEANLVLYYKFNQSSPSR